MALATTAAANAKRPRFDPTPASGPGTGVADGSAAGVTTSCTALMIGAVVGAGFAIRSEAGEGAKAGSEITTNTRDWSWNAYTRYTHRDPTDDDADTIDTIGVGADVERSFAQQFGARLGANYSDQSSDDSSVSDSSAYTIDVGVVWYPKGRRSRRES